MSKETEAEAFILKKQDFNETDQIVTLFTKDLGKIRGVVKAAKSVKSKIQPALQPYFLAKVSLAGRSAMPKIIRSQVAENFSQIISSTLRAKLCSAAFELVIKCSPDESPNKSGFEAIHSFLRFLDKSNNDEQNIVLKLGWIKFTAEFLRSAGLALKLPQEFDAQQNNSIFFNLEDGGYLVNAPPHAHKSDILRSNQSRVASVSELEPNLVLNLLQTEYEKIDKISVWPQVADLVVKRFKDYAEYQLEREMKAQKFLFAG